MSASMVVPESPTYCTQVTMDNVETVNIRHAVCELGYLFGDMRQRRRRRELQTDQTTYVLWRWFL